MQITNLLNWHSGKWYEICIFATNNQDEKEEVIARFLYKDHALNFLETMPNKEQYTEIIIR